MESLAEIMARVEQLAFAREEERSASLSILSSPSSLELATLPLDLPLVELLTPPEYIQAEAFLEVSGYFTPSSKRIKSIYTKEKKLREYIDERGNKRAVKVEVSANHKLGLPITSDLDYYRAFLKICDEIVDRDGRFRLPIGGRRAIRAHSSGFDAQYFQLFTRIKNSIVNKNKHFLLMLTIAPQNATMWF